jgi:hypothetical protein
LRHSGRSAQAFLTRISTEDFNVGAWDSIQLLAKSNSWIPYNQFDVSNVAVLFDNMASETTLQYHSVLQAWFVVIVNSFVYGSTIMFRMAASPNGSWSEPIPVSSIPSHFLQQQSDFCYAGKVWGGCVFLFVYLAVARFFKDIQSLFLDFLAGTSRSIEFFDADACCSCQVCSAVFFNHSHLAELQTSEDEIVLTFNCNTPSLTDSFLEIICVRCQIL